MTSHTTQHFEIHQGSAKNLTFSVTDENGAIVDITNATVKWVLSADVTSSALLTKTGTVTNGPGGVFTVALTGDDTDGLSGMYYHEARLVDGSSDSNPSHVSTGYVNAIGTNTKDD